MLGSSTETGVDSAVETGEIGAESKMGVGDGLLAESISQRTDFLVDAARAASRRIGARAGEQVATTEGQVLRAPQAGVVRMGALRDGEGVLNDGSGLRAKGSGRGAIGAFGVRGMPRVLTLEDMFETGALFGVLDLGKAGFGRSTCLPTSVMVRMKEGPEGFSFIPVFRAGVDGRPNPRTARCMLLRL